MALGQILSQSLLRNERSIAPAKRSPAALSSNLNRLLSAAVVSPRFRGVLLSDPVAALALGYNGETFQLTPVEYDAVTSLRVSTVRDFAAALLRTLHYAPADAARYESESQVGYRMTEVAAQ